MQKEQFDITGMTCSACSARVEKSVSKLPGIVEVSVNLLKNSMVASYDGAMLHTDQIVRAVEKAGYGAIPKRPATGDSRTGVGAKKPEAAIAQTEYKQIKQRLMLSALFTVPLFYLSMGHMMGWPLPDGLLGMEHAMSFAFTQFLLVIPVVFINIRYFRMGLKTLVHGSPNMDSLIAIGAGAAVVAFGMVVVGLNNFMDSVFVGQMVGSVQMGAVLVAYPFTLINGGTAAMIGIGSASVLDRAIGRKDEQTIQKIMGNLTAMVLLLSAVIMVLGIIFTRQILSLAGAGGEMLDSAESYLRKPCS